MLTLFRVRNSDRSLFFTVIGRGPRDVNFVVDGGRSTARGCTAHEPVAVVFIFGGAFTLINDYHFLLLWLRKRVSDSDVATGAGGVDRPEQFCLTITGVVRAIPAAILPSLVYQGVAGLFGANDLPGSVLVNDVRQVEVNRANLEGLVGNLTSRLRRHDG